jgi:hypothetical protein
VVIVAGDLLSEFDHPLLDSVGGNENLHGVFARLARPQEKQLLNRKPKAGERGTQLARIE